MLFKGQGYHAKRLKTSIVHLDNNTLDEYRKSSSHATQVGFEEDYDGRSNHPAETLKKEHVAALGPCEVSGGCRTTGVHMKLNCKPRHFLWRSYGKLQYSLYMLLSVHRGLLSLAQQFSIIDIHLFPAKQHSALATVGEFFLVGFDNSRVVWICPADMSVNSKL
jgi:hypothetical protein